MLPVLPYASSVAARLIHTQTHQSLQLPPSHELMNFKSDAHSDALHAGSRHVAGPAQQHSLDCAHTGHARALCVATASTALHQPSHNMLVTPQKPNPVPYHVSPPPRGHTLETGKKSTSKPVHPAGCSQFGKATSSQFGKAFSQFGKATSRTCVEHRSPPRVDAEVPLNSTFHHLSLTVLWHNIHPNQTQDKPCPYVRHDSTSTYYGGAHMPTQPLNHKSC